MRIFVALIAIFFFSSCNSGNSVPKNILPPEKMESVVWDLIRADEVISYRKMRDSAYTDKKGRQLLDTVFSLHKISQQAFQKSLKYYQRHPQQLKIVLDSMQSRVSQAEVSPVQ